MSSPLVVNSDPEDEGKNTGAKFEGSLLCDEIKAEHHLSFKF